MPVKVFNYPYTVYILQVRCKYDFGRSVCWCTSLHEQSVVKKVSEQLIKLLVMFFWWGHIWRLFHLWLCFITFGGRLAHLAYHVHKSGRKTLIIIIFWEITEVLLLVAFSESSLSFGHVWQVPVYVFVTSIRWGIQSSFGVESWWSIDKSQFYRW